LAASKKHHVCMQPFTFCHARPYRASRIRLFHSTLHTTSRAICGVRSDWVLEAQRSELRLFERQGRKCAARTIRMLSLRFYTSHWTGCSFF